MSLWVLFHFVVVFYIFVLGFLFVFAFFVFCFLFFFNSCLKIKVTVVDVNTCVRSVLNTEISSVTVRLKCSSPSTSDCLVTKRYHLLLLATA